MVRLLRVYTPHGNYIGNHLITTSSMDLVRYVHLITTSILRRVLRPFVAQSKQIDCSVPTRKLTYNHLIIQERFLTAIFISILLSISTPNSRRDICFLIVRRFIQIPDHSRSFSPQIKELNWPNAPNQEQYLLIPIRHTCSRMKFPLREMLNILHR